MAKTKGAKAASGDKQYAESADTATLERPDSTRSQRAVLQSAPADRALSEVQTPSAFSYTDEDGGTITAYPVTKELANGSSVTEVMSKSGGERGWATTGTVGKTATDRNGDLLVPANLIEGRFGGKVTVNHAKGTAKVAAPEGAAKTAKETDRGASRAREYVQAEESKAAAKKAAPKAKKAKPAKAGKAKKTDKQESAA